jgi:hypothetical protein
MKEMSIAFKVNNKMHFLHLFFSYFPCELKLKSTHAYIAVNLCYVLINFAYNNILKYASTNDYTRPGIQQIICNSWAVIFYNYKALTFSYFKTLKLSFPVLWMLLWNISANSDTEDLEHQTVSFNSPCDTQLEKKC